VGKVGRATKLPRARPGGPPRGVLAAIAVMALAGCAGDEWDAHSSAAQPALAEVAGPAARKALGTATPYVPSLSADQHTDLLARSIGERRQAAWRVAAHVVERVPLQFAAGTERATAPRWLTWYTQRDFERMFRGLYRDLGVEGRRQRQPFAPGFFSEIEQWNQQRADEGTTWLPARYEQWLDTLDRPVRWHSLGSTHRTLLSPAAVEHYFASYRQVADCVAPVGRLRAEFAAAAPANRAPCFPAEFPAEAALVKTSWFRAGFGRQLPAYDTSAAAMARRLADPGGAWQADGLADPQPEQIFAMETDAGAVYLLPALHIMARDVRDWIWITLWWSPSPDSDFGQDRPAELSGVWRNYKLCVATHFDEDGVLDERDRDRFPDLAAALDAVQMYAGEFSWCSNPYLEQGTANHLTNCIGCHQHAGSGRVSSEILSDPALAPQGRPRVLDTFPADYQWSFSSAPEQLAELIRRRIDYHDAVDFVP
jgi:hypothetical protein